MILIASVREATSADGRDVTPSKLGRHLPVSWELHAESRPGAAAALWLLLTCCLLPFPAWSQQVGAVVGSGSAKAETSTTGSAVATGPVYFSPPALTPAQAALRESQIGRTQRSIPARPGSQLPVLPPTVPPTAAPISASAKPTPILAPVDFTAQSSHDFTSLETGGSTETATVGEPSLGSMTNNIIFYTANWFAARSMDGGASFNYVDPYSLFPSINGGFCCDQVVHYAPNQNMLIWSLLYGKDATSGTLRIAVAAGSANVASNTWTYYSFNPQAFGFPSGNWMDFPNLTVGATHLYITANVFTTSNDAFTGSVILRIPLASLAAGGNITYSYYTTPNLDSWRCTEGAGTTMYCGTHTSGNVVRILRWDDGSGTVNWDDVQLGGFTYLSAASATSPDGTNWAGRADSRILGAYVANGVVGFMFGAGNDATYAYPYTIVARFDQSTRALLTQQQIWSPSFAWLYPAVSVNASGNLGGVIAYGGGTLYPNEAAWIVDDLHTTIVPMETYALTSGNKGPTQNGWGDYFSTRRHATSSNTWVTGVYQLNNGGGNANVLHKFVSFGRVRDFAATPDLTIAKTHSGVFNRNQTGATYNITVSNVGTASTTGTVVVTDTVPAGLTATSIAGSGWNCTQPAGPCTRADSLAAGSAYPAIVLTVNVAGNAPATVTNTTTVAGGGQTSTANDMANDPTAIQNGQLGATISIVNGDPAGVGFNDATPVSPVGGNAGTTLGQQRLIAFQAAADKWGATLASSIPIRIRATWTALTCTANSAVLGSAGAATSFRDFAGAPVAGHWYPKALANKLSGTELNSNSVDINANFNVNLGNSGCLTGIFFYLGLDNNHGANVDLVTVLLHEFGHGLGFATITNGQTGAQANGFPHIWDDFLFSNVTNKKWSQMTDLERAASAIDNTHLVWNGPNVTSAIPQVLQSSGGVFVGADTSGRAQMYAPASFQPGSSVSHYDTALSPNQLMEPAINGNLTHEVTAPNDLTFALLKDIGWTAPIVTAPDLTVAKTHSGNFTQGQTGATYNLTVTNSGNAATSGTVSLSDTVPAGLTATAIAGSGWSCTQPAGPCTRADSLAASGSFPVVVLTVNVAANAPASVTNSASVSGGGETNTANNSASDLTTINPAVLVPDLTITKTHAGNFTPGQVGATYTITVSNSGAGATSGTVTVTDTLPTGLTATAISGTGWTCTQPAGPCTRSNALAAGGSHPAITLTVNVSPSAPSSVTNIANVSGGGDSNTANNQASDPTTIGSQVQFISVNPCRIMDTRASGGFVGSFGPPSLVGGATRSIPIPSSSCGIPGTARAYSLNVTVIPKTGSLAFLTIWPTGQTQPNVSTLNSWDGSVLANAAIVPAGTNGSINVFATDNADLVVDVNGYFAPPAANSLMFFPLTPCRVLDTRNANGTFGGPILAGGVSRSFPLRSSSCGIPATAQSYSLNVTVAPTGPLGYLTAWPTGLSQPLVSTLNAIDGTVLANAAIVPAGTGGAVSFFASNNTHLVVDINGYFAPPAVGGLNFYPMTPCRVLDTRNATGPYGGPIVNGIETRAIPVRQSACGLPAGAQAYSLNMTVVPPGFLSFLAVWPTGLSWSGVSTLNDYKGLAVANAALVPAGTNGAVNIYVSNPSHVIMDINGYFGQ